MHATQPDPPHPSAAAARLDIVLGGDSHRRVIALSGEVDLATHAQLAACLAHVVDEPDPAPGLAEELLIVDLFGLTFLSARGAVELVRAADALDARRRRLVVRALGSGVRRVLQIVDSAGVLHLEPVDPDADREDPGAGLEVGLVGDERAAPA